MAHDQGVSSSAAIDIDKLYLEQVETRLVHNLGVIDRMLGDQIRFPVRAKNADEQDALAMRSQLLAVSDSQRKALDLVSGTLETENLGQMQHEMSDQMKNATGQTTPQDVPTDAPASFLGAAGLPEYSPVAGLPTTASKLSTIGGHTAYDYIAEALEGTQSTTARREQVATSSVIAAVGECRASIGPAASPSPTATPTP
jgi:hypothetical protein